MKTINLKAKSWHYFLAVTMGNFDPDSGDFCSYVRNVILGLVFTIAISAVLGGIGSSLLAGVLNIVLLAYHFIMGTAYTAPSFMMFGTALLCAISVVMALASGAIFVKNRLQERKYANADKPDSFLKSAYKSFKEKVCFKVNFDNNGDK